MNLHNLKDGNITSYSVATKYFHVYFKLVCQPHTAGLRYILLTDPLKELFRPSIEKYNKEKGSEMDRAGKIRSIDIDKFTYVDLPKILGVSFKKTTYFNTQEIYIKNIIPHPDHLDDLSDFLSEATNIFKRHHQKLREFNKAQRKKLWSDEKYQKGVLKIRSGT